ncbi:hypothetical protein N7493_000941 [Penicillium malachiteum]|uniref:Glycoside hydrolase family 32 protein n=1 Tax=Penicillium malachiteum TaxID=1324776 RepID=A0AAD6N1C8_9EURO|nr:hypothetical protein N7493_000941 [Penicillium malachiteum]
METPTTYYSRWRPRYHIQPLKGWLNDPCGPGYSPQTGLYHVAFQWNPNAPRWGNIVWGVAWSRDLCAWEVSDFPSISFQSDDGCKGIFTGCLRPTNVEGEADGTMTIIYTSAHHLPIHYTRQYVRGSERIHLATSTDNGKTWDRHSSNPILPGPPLDLEVTGWRDPFIAPWESMDKILNHDGRHSLYAVISGSIKDQTPTTLLYRVLPNALDNWEYIGPLARLGMNFCPPGSNADYGKNWEVTNFVSLVDKSGISHEFLIMGIEGCMMRPGAEKKTKMRAHSAQLWMGGKIDAPGGKPSMTYEYGGRLDHGSFYAANSFWDPVGKKNILFGWILEDDLPEPLREEQGWAGMLSLPRMLELIEMKFVCGTWKSDIEDLVSFEKSQDDQGTYTLRTLAAVPDPRLKKLRGTSLSAPKSAGDALHFPVPLPCFECETSLSLHRGIQKAGFSILHSLDGSNKTSLFFDAEGENFTIDRSKSTAVSGINTSPEIAPHTLLKFKDESGEITNETLDIRLLYDVSVLEVFVNGRTAITTRVYPESGMCFGVETFYESKDGDERPDFKRFDIWEISADRLVQA